MYKKCFIIYISIFCNKFQQSSSLRRKPFTVDVMIVNGNGQQIQVCNLLVLNTKNVAWLVARHLSKNIEISPKKCANLIQKNWGEGGGGWQLCICGFRPVIHSDFICIIQFFFFLKYSEIQID